VTTIAIDGMNEEEFRRSIESRMRHGLAGKAANQLRALLAPFAGPDKLLPERFLTVTADDLQFNGWDELVESLRRHDRPGRPVTALSIAFGWPGEDVPQPDADGRLSPLIETGYYTDDAFPFSQSAREDLLDGYSFHGCTWTGDCEATDTVLWLSGIDDLHGALALLEARLLASDEPDEDGIRAGSLGACLLSVLLFQAVEARIARDGMPRPLCIMAGSSGVYPYFDAPVAGFPEEARKASEGEDDEVVVDAGVPIPRYSSLLVTGIPRARKRAVLVLEETADEEASRISRLRGLAHGETIAEPAQPEARPEAAAPPSVSETAIVPAPASPLLVKKPSGQSWDFREMLSPYEPEEGLAGAGPLEPDDDWDMVEPLEPERDRGGDPPFEPQPEWVGNAPIQPDWVDPAPLTPAQDWGSPESLEPAQDWGGDAPLDPEPGADEPLELEQDWREAASFDPVQDTAPVPSASDDEAPVSPGFSLFETLRLERPPSLFPLPAFHTVEETEGEPEPAMPAAETSVEEPAAASVTAEPAEETEPLLLELEELEEAAAPAPLELEEEPAAQAEPDPSFAFEAAEVPEAPIAAQPALPAWPLDPAWLHEAETRILAKAPYSASPRSKRVSVERPAAKGLWARISDWWYGRS
jgi:hypothetical protein